MGIEDAALKCFKNYQSEINVVFISNQTSNEHYIDLGVVQKSEQHCCIFWEKLARRLPDCEYFKLALIQFWFDQNKPIIYECLRNQKFLVMHLLLRR